MDDGTTQNTKKVNKRKAGTLVKMGALSLVLFVGSLIAFMVSIWGLSGFFGATMILSGLGLCAYFFTPDF